jgi:hypothetical protein
LIAFLEITISSDIALKIGHCFSQLISSHNPLRVLLSPQQVRNLQHRLLSELI